jgi:hypothetical protein
MTRRIVVVPGLVLDDEMYEIAVAALRQHAADLVSGFTWDRFTARRSWCLVPDANRPDVPFYKAELVLLDEAPWTRTVKLNVWTAADVRKDGAPWPHKHPWPFDAHLLLGGQKESRYVVTGGRVEMTTCEHVAGDVNGVPLDVFHEITEILAPGRTMSLMDCGPSQGIGSWGYLNPDTGAFIPTAPDPEFAALLLDRNPHLG